MIYGTEDGLLPSTPLTIHLPTLENIDSVRIHISGSKCQYRNIGFSHSKSLKQELSYFEKAYQNQIGG